VGKQIRVSADGFRPGRVQMVAPGRGGRGQDGAVARGGLEEVGGIGVGHGRVACGQVVEDLAQASDDGLPGQEAGLPGPGQGVGGAGEQVGHIPVSGVAGSQKPFQSGSKSRPVSKTDSKSGKGPCPGRTGAEAGPAGCRWCAR
jgi:hypothetical protein